MLLDEGWTPDGESPIRYTLGLTAGEYNRHAHRAKAWIPLNGTDMAILTQCGIRSTQFALASKMQIKQLGECPVCSH